MFKFLKKRKKKEPVAVETLLHKELSFAATEAYKLLRINLLFSLPDNGLCRVIGVTSSIRGEGKSTTSINLSYALATLDKRVLLIDGDLRLPSVASKIGISCEPGLSDTLISLGDKREHIRVMPENSNWHILTAGSIPPNPAEMLGSPKMSELLRELSPSYDFIIIDLPPVNIVSDALIVSPHLDGLMVVVRQDYSKRREVMRCINQLELAEARIIGFVMSAVRESGSVYRKKASYGYGGYGTRRAAEDSADAAEPENLEDSADTAAETRGDGDLASAADVSVEQSVEDVGGENSPESERS